MTAKFTINDFAATHRLRNSWRFVIKRLRTNDQSHSVRAGPASVKDQSTTWAPAASGPMSGRTGSKVPQVPPPCIRRSGADRQATPHSRGLASVGAELREFNGEPGHVHLLVHYPPGRARSELVNRLKGVSSRRRRQRYPYRVRKYLWGKHFWNLSYFAASCDGAPLIVIKQYIEQQTRPD